MVPLDRIRLSIRSALRARHFVSQNPSKVLRSRSNVSDVATDIRYSLDVSTCFSRRRIFCRVLVLS
jgi:hypothetical protein